MATVPYSPVPSVALDSSGVSGIQNSVPAAAFGGEIGQAIAGVGKAVEGAGDQLWERAVWLQNLNNQAEARQKNSDYTIAAGKLHADYNSLEGKNAVDAYPAYAAKLKGLRGQLRDTLSTPMSQRMFDTESMGTMSHAIFNGGSHAAAQQKAFVKGSMDADISSTFETVSQNPKDDINFRKGLSKVEGTVRQKGQLEGLPPQAIDNNVQSVQSKFWANKFEQQAKEEPFQAQTALYDNRDKMNAADFKRVEALVGTQVHAVGSANIARDILAAHIDADGNLTATMSELHAKATDLAKKMSPDDAQFPNQVVKTLDAQFNQVKYAKRIEQTDARQAVASAVQNGATSVQEVLNDPATYAAYKTLTKVEQNKLPGQIDNYIKSRDRGLNERMMTEITGLKNNDVEGFLNLDPTDPKYALSQPQVRQVSEMQKKVKKQTGQDPRVDRAMGWMRGSFGAQMEAMGVFKRTQQNKIDYDHLTGAVQSALDIWSEDHKKPPTNKEFNEQIAPEILKVQKTPGAIFGSLWPNEKTLFKHDTGSKEYTTFATQIKADITAKGGSEPSDEEVYKAYTRVQLLKLYPPKRKPEVVQ